jgi:hypothetical protein
LLLVRLPRVLEGDRVRDIIHSHWSERSELAWIARVVRLGRFNSSLPDIRIVYYCGGLPIARWG